MKKRTLLPDARHSCAHVLSMGAIEAATSVGKLKALDGMKFKDVRVFIVLPMAGKDASALYELTRGEKKKYANHFCNIREPLIRKFGFLCALEDGNKLDGYIPYYSFADDIFGDEIMYAFFHKSIDAAVLLISKRADAAAAQVMYSMAEMTPFGKLCACCGGRAWFQEGKLKKCPCKTVRYCSKECQYAHWADHRGFCSRGRAEI
jgi:hypothetical protein